MKEGILLTYMRDVESSVFEDLLDTKGVKMNDSASLSGDQVTGYRTYNVAQVRSTT